MKNITAEEPKTSSSIKVLHVLCRHNGKGPAVCLWD